MVQKANGTQGIRETQSPTIDCVASAMEEEPRYAHIPCEFREAGNVVVLALPFASVQFALRNGNLEISCDRPIVINVPDGVVISSDQEVAIKVGRNECRIMPDAVAVESDKLQVRTEDGTLSGGRLTMRFLELALSCRKFHRVAERVFEYSREVYSRIEALFHVRAGRVRVEGKESAVIHSDTLRLAATKAVRVQGDSISLG